MTSFPAEAADRLKALLRSEGLRDLKSEVRQSSDQTGEYYLTHAQITAGDRVIIDLGPNPEIERGDWSDATLELFCEAVNHLPALLETNGALTEALERLQAIIDWADLAIRLPQEFDSHGVRNLDGPVFDAARELLAAAHQSPGEGTSQ